MARLGGTEEIDGILNDNIAFQKVFSINHQGFFVVGMPNYLYINMNKTKYSRGLTIFVGTYLYEKT